MSTDTARQFDPAGQVPDEYDISCDSCGYSLISLSTNRCPECGEPFDPAALPFARIPWLHRKRLGRINAYFRTVLMVCFLPTRFARELCRPVQICSSDARSFRLTTLWLATVTFAVSAIAVTALNISQSLGRAFLFSTSLPELLALYGTMLLLMATFHIFLRLATDMPVFIWKGHPSLPPTELAPIHHYASAPLAFLPLGLLIAGVWHFFPVLLPGSSWMIFLVLCGLGMLICAWVLVIALVFMQISTRPGPGRMLLLLVYLPFHWLIMLTITSLGLYVILIAGHFLFGGPN